MEKILTGNLLFAGCCVVYLVWWSVAFRPGFSAPMTIKGFLFLATAVLGVAGLAKIIQSCSLAGQNAQAAGTHGPHYMGIIATAAGVYIVLLLLTNLLMHRQVTTELMLIVFWACMEVCACSALWSGGLFGGKAFAVIVAIVLAAAASGMICYLKYYELEPMTAFYDGMVPLILFALVCVGLSVYQILLR